MSEKPESKTTLMTRADLNTEIKRLRVALVNAAIPLEAIAMITTPVTDAMVEAALSTEFEGSSVRNLINAALWPHGAYGNAKHLVRRALEAAALMNDKSPTPSTAPVDHFTRKEVLTSGARIAKTLRMFVADADQYLSVKLRKNLIEAAKDLEDMQND